MKKLIFALALAANFILILAVMSNTFDGDLGWHLRFGRDWAQSGHFPYTDSYTYSKFGTAYTNHEWGGDALFWFIYSRFGYTPLLLLTASWILAAFLLIQKTFLKKITAASLISSFVAIWSVTHLLVMRLAMITPLLAAATIYLLEKIDDDKKQLLWLLAPLLGVWSYLHGSWILGFIIINIYFFTSLTQKIAPKKIEKYLFGKIWDNRVFYQLLCVQALAILIIALNPYGLKIFTEIADYFQQGYYKKYISEWIPSYTFPIFWEVLILQTVALTLAARGYFSRRLTARQAVLYLAFFYSAWKYKRNALLIAPLAAPILTATAEHIYDKIKTAPLLAAGKILKLPALYAVIVLLSLNASYTLKIHLSSDIWSDPRLLLPHSFPLPAVTFLRARLNGQTPKIFNDFNWGGYLIYALPNAPIYLDGRGTATWMYSSSTSMLAHYHAIIKNPGGLAEIEKDNVRYVLMEKSNYFFVGPPDGINQLLFGSKLDAIFDATPHQLEIDLRASPKWELIYSDTNANIWERINHERE